MHSAYDGKRVLVIFEQFEHSITGTLSRKPAKIRDNTYVCEEFLSYESNG